MKTTIICEIGNFLVKIVKHVPGLMVIVNRPGTIKLWELAHENNHKTRKLRVLGHISPTCIRS